MVPEMHAALRGMINSKPSHDTKVTYSEGAGSAMVEGVSRVDGRVKNRRTGEPFVAWPVLVADNDKHAVFGRDGLQIAFSPTTSTLFFLSLELISSSINQLAYRQWLAFSLPGPVCGRQYHPSFMFGLYMTSDQDSLPVQGQ